MPRGFSGGEQEKMPMQETAVEFVYSRQKKRRTSFFLNPTDPKAHAKMAGIVNKAYITDFFLLASLAILMRAEGRQLLVPHGWYPRTVLKSP